VLDELAARDGARPVRDEVREEQTPLPAWKTMFDMDAVDQHHETTAEVDARLRQGCAKVTTTVVTHNHRDQRTRRGAMAKVINCECGYVVRGENDEDLLAGAEEHIRTAHPDLVGKISREDLLGMSEEAA